MFKKNFQIALFCLLALSSQDLLSSVDIIYGVAGASDGTPGNSGDDGPALGAELNLPTAVAVDVFENFYIADSSNNRIRVVNSSGIINNFAGNEGGTSGNSGDGGPATDATLNSPFGVALDTSGNVYIADTENHRIRLVSVSLPRTDYKFCRQ